MDKVGTLSLYVVAFIVIVPDSFSCLFVFYYNLGDVITQLLHCPGSHFYISLRTVSAHASKRFCSRRALKIRYCCIFVKSRTGLGLINCFYCCVSRGLFLYTVCENVFISLDYYNGF